MSIYEQYGIAPIINASGTVTRLGGAPMPQAVLDAFREAAGEWVPLDQLQAAASKRIAEITGTEAGLATAGSAAALTVGAAAILTGLDPGRMERLPHCDGFPHEFVVAREHRSGYDHAVRAAGVKFVEVGFNEIVSNAGVRRTEAWEYEAAFTENTAGVFYVHIPNPATPLREVLEVAHRHNLPVLVDAAGELPPRSNLRDIAATGADLVAYSGGKSIRGPQSTGILCGKRDLIASAALQMLDMDDHFELWDPPGDFLDKSQLVGIPRHGIARGMKVSKEEIVALLVALDLFASGAYDDERPAYFARLQTVTDALEGTTANCTVVESADGERPPTLEIAIDETSLGRSAFEVCRRLRNGSPPIYVSHGQLSAGKLVVHPLCLDDEATSTLAIRLREELTA
jgi:L-seryl-tRNA(Ser) seleniumtransferase